MYLMKKNFDFFFFDFSCFFVRMNKVISKTARFSRKKFSI